MVAILVECLEVLFGCLPLTQRWCSNSHDTTKVSENVLRDNCLQFIKDRSRIEMRVYVRPPNLSYHRCDIPIEVKETRRGHGLPIIADGSAGLISIILKALER